MIFLVQLNLNKSTQYILFKKKHIKHIKSLKIKNHQHIFSFHTAYKILNKI